MTNATTVFAQRYLEETTHVELLTEAVNWILDVEARCA